MPFVNVKLAGSLSHDQKAKISDEISATLERVAGKPKDATYVLIEEHSRENWAKGGVLLAWFRRPS